MTVEAFDAPTGERLIPYRASNNLIVSGCVLLPSSVEDGGAVGDVGEIIAEIRKYLDRYVALSEPFEEIAANYVLLTWVYDAFNEVPYIRLQGDRGTGKTRALLAIGSVCYKPVFASAASTVSPIFHILDAFGGTLILDEADFRYSDATSELTKILNNGTVKGLPVLRTMTNRHRELNPQAFQVFGPKIVAMREDFQDDALESRFFTEHTGTRALPAHIPFHLPDAMREEARALRNRLLLWRFANFDQIGPRPARSTSRAHPRFNQMALPLLSLAHSDEEADRLAQLLLRAHAMEESGPGETDTARIAAAVLAAFRHHAGPAVPLSAVVARFNDALASEEAHLGPRSVGHLIRSRLGLELYKSRGVSVVPRRECGRVEAIATKLGISEVPANGDTLSRESTSIEPQQCTSWPSDGSV